MFRCWIPTVLFRSRKYPRFSLRKRRRWTTRRLHILIGIYLLGSQFSKILPSPHTTHRRGIVWISLFLLYISDTAAAAAASPVSFFFFFIFGLHTLLSSICPPLLTSFFPIRMILERSSQKQVQDYQPFKSPKKQGPEEIINPLSYQKNKNKNKPYSTKKKHPDKDPLLFSFFYHLSQIIPSFLLSLPSPSRNSVRRYFHFAHHRRKVGHAPCLHLSLSLCGWLIKIDKNLINHYISNYRKDNNYSSAPMCKLGWTGPGMGWGGTWQGGECGGGGRKIIVEKGGWLLHIVNRYSWTSYGSEDYWVNFVA